MNPQALITIFLTILAGIATLFVVPLIINSPTGGISALIFLLGLITCAIAINNPRRGLIPVIIFALYTDYLKKIAVYYGEISLLTIMQVMILTYGCVAAIYAGILFRAMLKQIVMTKTDLGIFVATGFLMAAIFLIARAQNGIMGGAMLAVGIAFYAGLLPTLHIILKDYDDSLKFLRTIFWLMLPWSIYGVYQFYFGFNSLEWFYAETGLSPISSAHLLQSDDPRVMSFGSGPMNYGAILVPACFGVWHSIKFKNHRGIYTLATIIYFLGLLASEQRAVIITPFFVLIFFLFIQRTRTIMIAYGFAGALFLLSIFFSDSIYHNIDRINHALSTDSRWFSGTLRFGTLEDRLIGWMRLKDPESYTFLGELGDKLAGTKQWHEAPDYSGKNQNHDLINKVLIQFGVVGVGLASIVAVAVLYFIHQLSLSIPPGREKSLATLLTSIFVPYVGIAIATGGNFNSNPYNFLFWSFLAVTYAISCRNREARRKFDNPKNEIQRSFSLVSPETPR